MGEFVANFQKKHGQQVPMPKIYRDEDSSDSEGLELADWTKVGRKTAGGAGGSGRGKPCKKAATSGGTNTGGSDVASTSDGGGIGGSRGDDPGRDKKRSRGDEGDGGDDPNKCRKTGGEGEPSRLTVARKEPRKAGTVYPPINRKLPVLYISRKKERTMLGHRMLDWDSSAAENDPRGEDAGETGKTRQVQSGDCGSEGHPSLPKNLSTAHPEVAFPEVGEGDCPGLQDRPAVPVSCDTVSPGSSGGLPCQAI